ncbi:hypothetical protein IU405_14205 [Polaribacter sp. BAL334]|uniref:hypothetical protein n=1 Tax=Polaribacter sp. BAL334 TaxID=1708178 RepID=UPI0018D22FA0|nr:hypothetical protein [Polaribacter sp. BAL334]MBG7613402.1 hypothetical protein [Polaribacter sp. BAL334]
MSTERKIENITKKIENICLNKFQLKLNDILSFCESKIEKLMILQLFHYFSNYTLGLSHDYFDEMQYYNIDFIDRWICFDGCIGEEKKSLMIHIEKYKYRWIGGMPFKYIGFKALTNFTGYGENGEYKEFEVYPQYEIEIADKAYRIDIVIKLNLKKDDKVLKSQKIAIECDGYDYHKDPIKFREDKIRERALKSIGFKDVLRYSGSEIYSIDDDLKKIHFTVQEIVNIIQL